MSSPKKPNEGDEIIREAKILLVDDKPEDLNILNNIFQNHGYQIFNASNGNDALALALNKQPDLILLDILLPDIDGYTLCRKLKDNPLTKKIPVVFISALGDPNSIVRGFNAGAIDYVAKPFRMEEVLARVKTHVVLQHTRKQLEDSLSHLKEERDFIATVLDIAGALVVVLDTKGKIIQFNRACEQLTGFNSSEVIGKQIWNLFIPPEDLKSTKDIHKRLTSGVFPHHYENHWKDKHGIAHLISWSSTVLTDNLGDVTFLVETGIDITEQRLAESALRESEERFRLAFENANTGMCLVDLQGNILRANNQMSQIFGYSQQELGKMSLDKIIFSEDQEINPRFRTRAVQGEQRTARFDIRLYHRSGEMIWAQVSASIICDDKNNPLYFIYQLQDVTERVKAEQRLQYLATHDLLTELPNRALFYDRLNHALANAQRKDHMLAVLFLDLDHFKTINDQFGHDIGDRALFEAARRLEKCIRASDSIARMGGDEFTFCLENLNSKNDAATVAQKILGQISIPFNLNHIEANLSASIGISLFPKDGKDAKTLLSKADLAMYHAKQDGKSKYKFFGSQ